MEKVKICGACGTIIDEQGNALPQKVLDELNLSESEVNSLELDWCYGCIMEQQEEPTYVRVTRDMASDAGDPSLEGQIVKW